MLAVKDFRQAQEIIDDLHARGREEWARTIEAILDAALAAFVGQRLIGQREFLTTGQSARALGVSIQTVKNWITSGKLKGTRLGGRTVILRSELLAYLEELDNRRGEHNVIRKKEQNVVEGKLARQRREYVLGGLPKDLASRLDIFHQKVEDGKRLSKDERSEMARLERELMALASQQMERWLEQHQSSR